MDDFRAPFPLIQAFDGFVPQIAEGVYVAPNATVVGNVVLEEGVNVWYSAVLRGDIGKITVGAHSTIQDLCCLHTKKNGPDVVIGQHVSIGHNCVIHGATLEDGVFVGNASVVMDGAVVGKQSVVSAGSYVPRGARVPPGVMVRGRPAKVVRELTDEEKRMGSSTAEHQEELARKARGIYPEETSR